MSNIPLKWNPGLCHRRPYEEHNPLLRSTDIIDNIAKIYEGPYYGTVQMINAELGIPSMEEMAKMVMEAVDGKNGVGLDAACGMGFFARPLAQKMRRVYGIDISMVCWRRRPITRGRKG